jgi:Spy/CpxP family protein refolding chaperone
MVHGSRNPLRSLPIGSGRATRRPWWAMVALAGMLTGTQVSLAQAPDSPRREPGRPRSFRPHGPSDEEKEKTRVRIGMTKEQQAQIEALYSETEQKRRDAMKQLGEKHMRLGALYDAYDVDKKQERELLRDIMEIHWRLLRIHSENEARIRKILTKEQHEKLRALIRESMEQARSRWRTGPKPPGPAESRPKG